MSIPISCPTCRKTALAPEAEAGRSVACAGCGTVIPVPAFPMAVPAASEPARPALPPSPPEASASGEVSTWVWRGLEFGAFVAICVIFAFIGAASSRDEPGLAASRMARKVGAPLALLLIAAVELVRWLVKKQPAPLTRAAREGRTMPTEGPPSQGCCPSCQGDLVPGEWGLRGSTCRACRRYFPSPDECDEVRATFRQWRHLLFLVAELHALGYERARVVPWIEDTAGGGDWHCIIAPASMISPAHGARIDERIAWWGGPSPPGRDFPYYIGRGWRGLPGMPPGFDSAHNLARGYPKLAEQCLGRDLEYVEWYRGMLQTTGPDGVVYASAFWDHDDPRPIAYVRVIGAEGKRDTVVPLPPPGRAASRG